MASSSAFRRLVRTTKSWNRTQHTEAAPAQNSLESFKKLQVVIRSRVASAKLLLEKDRPDKAAAVGKKAMSQVEQGLQMAEELALEGVDRRLMDEYHAKLADIIHKAAPSTPLTSDTSKKPTTKKDKALAKSQGRKKRKNTPAPSHSPHRRDQKDVDGGDKAHHMKPRWTIDNHPALQMTTGEPSSSKGAEQRTALPIVEEAPPVTFAAADVHYESVPPLGQPVEVAKLSHGLERVLFSPGPHFLKDPRTGVYNFSPSLERVPATKEFEFEKLPQYVIASKDDSLMAIAERENSTFVSSTSSSVGMLCQIYFWFSQERPINTSMLSKFFSKQAQDFGAGQQLPVSVILRPSGPRYSVDADKSIDPTSASNILSDYGHMMEKLLTCPPEEFRRFLKDAENPAESEALNRQAYHYMKIDKVLLRSQLDACHELLPNKVFDVKTRGSYAVRQDRLNYEEAAGYQVDRLHGSYKSFEREYYDLIRSAFLKYQFQARIGNMDGCLVAYHSTTKFFGFQYVPISEMDEALFGSPEDGDRVFRLATGMLQRILDEVIQQFQGPISATFAADGAAGTLAVFVRSHNPEKPDDDSGRIKLIEFCLHGSGSSNAERLPDKLTYSIRTSDTDAPPGQSTFPEAKVRKMLSKVRDVQRMFTQQTLPTGVTVSEVKAAAERAKEVDPSTLDPDDLSLRFPLTNGLSYRAAPSKAVAKLRVLARQGSEDLKRQQEDDQQGPRTVYRLRTSLEQEEVD